MVVEPLKVLAAVSRIVPGPALTSPPLRIGTETCRSTAAAPLATVIVRVPPVRSMRPVGAVPELVPIVAVLPEVPAIVTSPFRASVAGVVPRLSASVSKVRLALPAVSVRAASTWIVWAESLAPPEIDIDEDTCIDIGVDSATGT